MEEEPYVPWLMFWRRDEESYERVDYMFRYIMLWVHEIARDVPVGKGTHWGWDEGQKIFKALTCTSRWMRHLMKKLRFEIQPRVIQGEINQSIRRPLFIKRRNRRKKVEERRYEAYAVLLAHLQKNRMKADDKTRYSSPWRTPEDPTMLFYPVAPDMQIGPWTVEQALYQFSSWCGKRMRSDDRHLFFSQYWKQKTKHYLYYRRKRGKIWFIEKTNPTTKKL
jgi:hypothetical protein